MATLEMVDVFKNNSDLKASEELAADGMILGIDYSPERNEFAYCSADKMAYLRKFSPNGAEMKLVAVMQGHEAEVTQIKWHRQFSQWITGSEDRTIRIWPAEGIPCLRVINNDGPVTALCIDIINGCIITGSQDKIIRVFDIDKKEEIGMLLEFSVIISFSSKECRTYGRNQKCNSYSYKKSIHFRLVGQHCQSLER